MRNLTFILTLFIPSFVFAQSISGTELLEKAIRYHDPNSKWNSFKGNLNVRMTTPKASPRDSKITIDLPKEYFSVIAKRDSVSTTYTINKGNCTMLYNGRLIDSIKAKAKNMNCSRATLYKDYYTYLYGLPMKLKDPGTNIANKVEEKLFKGKAYLVLKVTYDKSTGSDIWYFYFDSNTYAMEVYQFFKTDDNGQVKPLSGEYILLNEDATINGIKMPKIRAWYYNKDDGYLGTDTLVKD